MDSTTYVTCPSCKETNAGSMAFCIYCGAALRPPAAEAIVQPKPTLPAARKCRNCGVDDELNGKFCISCGASIEDEPDGKPKGKETSGFLMQSELSSLKQDLQKQAATGAGSSIAVSGIISVFVAVLLGLAGGALVAAGLLAVKTPEPAPVKQGLAILTSKPLAGVLLQMPDKHDFLMGKLGKTGALAVEDLPAGDYHVSLTDAAGNRDEADVNVKDGQPSTLKGFTAGE